MWNVAGLSNVEDIKNQIEKTDILMLYETWNQNSSIVLEEFNAVDFELIISPAIKTAVRGRAKGGIICFVNKLIYKPNNIYENDNFIYMRIELNNQSVIVCVVYISPNDDLDVILSELEETLIIFKNKYLNEPIFVGGDFNARVGS